MRRIIGSLIFGFSFTALLFLIGVLVYGAPVGGRFDWALTLLKVLTSWPQYLIDFEQLGLNRVLLSAVFDVILYSLIAYGASFLIRKPARLQDS